MGSPDAFDTDGNCRVEIDAPGYVQEEFVASDTASAHVPVGELPQRLVEPERFGRPDELGRGVVAVQRGEGLDELALLGGEVEVHVRPRRLVALI
jgi:hypothetical protein